jgi:hypothetical protein
MLLVVTTRILGQEVEEEGLVARGDVPVDKFVLKKGRLTLRIDAVNYCNSAFLAGTDLWANLYIAFDKQTRERCGLFLPMVFGPPLETTLHSALQCDKVPGEKVPCYVLRRDTMPRYDTHKAFIVNETNGDGRFRGKVHARSTGATAAVDLVPAWRASDGGVRVLLQPGKNKGGYWKADQMIQQLDDAIDAGGEAFPTCELLFTFDQSCNHTAFVADALRASVMLKKDGTSA